MALIIPMKGADSEEVMARLLDECCIETVRERGNVLRTIHGISKATAAVLTDGDMKVELEPGEKFVSPNLEFLHLLCPAVDA